MVLMCRSSGGQVAPMRRASVAAPAMAARIAPGLALPVRGERTRSESLKAMGSASFGGCGKFVGVEQFDHGQRLETRR